MTPTGRPRSTGRSRAAGGVRKEIAFSAREFETVERACGADFQEWARPILTTAADGGSVFDAAMAAVLGSVDQQPHLCRRALRGGELSPNEPEIIVRPSGFEVAIRVFRRGAGVGSAGLRAFGFGTSLAGAIDALRAQLPSLYKPGDAMPDATTDALATRADAHLRRMLRTRREADPAHKYITLGVLAGAYKGKRNVKLTHTIREDQAGDDAAPALCGQKNIADAHSATAEQQAAEPTCPRCLAKDPRFVPVCPHPKKGKVSQ